jgi:putative PIN family toxin of toxin-antitoxin system
VKIVIDTNVLIAAFLASGTSRDLLDEVLFRRECILSDYILNEFRRTLCSRKFGFPPVLTDAFVSYLVKYSRIEKEIISSDLECPDPDDLKILLLCRTVKADLFITGDQELPALKKTGSTLIIKPAQFWKFKGGISPLTGSWK